MSETLLLSSRSRVRIPGLAFAQRGMLPAASYITGAMIPVDGGAIPSI
jgi:NAD(P)-dependent dehydrogenase (short-subunit alcohol dehydrogenase family)